MYWSLSDVAEINYEITQIIWLCFHHKKCSTIFLICLNELGLNLGSLSPTETVQMQWSPLAACQDRPGKSHGNRSYHSHPRPAGWNLYNNKALVFLSNSLHCVGLGDSSVHLNKNHMTHTHSVTLQLWTHWGCCLQIKAVRQGGPRAKHWTWTKIRRESVRPLFLTQQNQKCVPLNYKTLGLNCTQFLEFLFEMWNLVSTCIII